MNCANGRWMLFDAACRLRLLAPYLAPRNSAKLALCASAERQFEGSASVMAGRQRPSMEIIVFCLKRRER
jgi:hypothetical protein